MMQFYRLADGRFIGQAFDGAADALAANTPEGCGAIEGVTDWLSQAVDLATGELVDYQPPAPADDALRTWSWSIDARRWLPIATLAALKADRAVPVQVDIDDAELQQARPLREVMLAVIAAAAPPADSVAALHALETRINTARAVLAAIRAAADAQALAAISWPPP